MSKNKYPSIDGPSLEPRSLQNAVNQIKENVELLTGVRPGSDPAVTWQDLVRLGIVKPADVPR